MVKNIQKPTSTMKVAQRKSNQTDRTRAALREETNRQLSQLRHTFYAMFHANPVPTALVRVEDDLFINVNMAFLKYFDLQLQQVLGHTAQDLQLDIDPKQRAALLAQLRRDGMIENYEYSVPLADGRQAVLLIFLQLLQLDDTEALLVTFLDITQRIEAEHRIQQLGRLLAEAEQQERVRISRILHDDLQQRLFALKVQIPFMQLLHQQADWAQYESVIHELEQGLTEAIAMTRQLSVDLDWITLPDQDLAAALPALAIQMHNQYGLQVRLVRQPLRDPPEHGLQELLFQAARELLFNVVKHAGTEEALLQLEEVDAEMCLTVSDQGRGFDPHSIESSSDAYHGLQHIRQRLELLGCRMEVHSAPLAGTRVLLRCPQTH